MNHLLKIIEENRVELENLTLPACENENCLQCKTEQKIRDLFFPQTLKLLEGVKEEIENKKLPPATDNDWRDIGKKYYNLAFSEISSLLSDTINQMKK